MISTRAAEANNTTIGDRSRALTAPEERSVRLESDVTATVTPKSTRLAVSASSRLRRLVQVVSGSLPEASLWEDHGAAAPISVVLPLQGSRWPVKPEFRSAGWRPAAPG
jgi:hypothetical protein